MKSNLLKFGLIGLAAVLLQVLIFSHLSYGAVEPDFVLIILIWVIATQERTTAILFAAFTGFLTDFFLDFWGLHLLSKTLTTMFVYNFIPRIEETKLFLSQVFLLLLVISLVHNLLFLIAAFFTQIYQAEAVFFEVLFGSSLLTAVIGTIIHLLRDN
ncbi:rod shape-determining protein MreD [Natronogracilivirga saccharolytica]|uniref:Rod shape-determining protein MreD n=1 Tax=Natronogracilivirga saccharolytica TaxID=2812953 RepID=A0A8J7S6P4_9BACT|nr:rod shape-determining protein MreD [Natronogracilivirga saccharolytica]MBP3191156.1 rod shape-determining protein MreD [Natronogracilivirga saccharolytica]